MELRATLEPDDPDVAIHPAVVHREGVLDPTVGVRDRHSRPIGRFCLILFLPYLPSMTRKIIELHCPLALGAFLGPTTLVSNAKISPVAGFLTSYPSSLNAATKSSACTLRAKRTPKVFDNCPMRGFARARASSVANLLRTCT